MFPEVFEALCAWIAPHLPPERTVTVEKKVLATLWLIANKESYRSVADRFGFGKGALHRIVMCVCRALTVRRKDVIKWPQRHQLQRLAQKWEDSAGVPGVVGAIDGTYIEIPGKSDGTRDVYICRKGYPAVHLQVICNKDLLFLDAHTGDLGSAHDSRVFRRCDHKRFLESEEGRLPREFHILGDSAYPLKDYLLVPFRDNGHLSPAQIAFNKAHSSTRVEVERSIGLLKGKFRRLKYLDMTQTRDIPYVIFGSCVLHNFIILENGVDEEDIVLSDEEEEEEEEEGDIAGVEHRSGEDKRLAIAQSLV